MQKTLASLVASALAVVLLAPLPAQARAHPIAATPTTISVYSRVLQHINPQMPSWQSRDFARRVLTNAERWHLDPNVLVAIVTVESDWHTHARSSAGAIGLGQLMPGTAQMLGVNPRDPAQNLSGAARYISGLIQRFGNGQHGYELAFAAYNAGPHAIDEFGGVPPYDETQHYVVKVFRALANLEHTVRVPKYDLDAQAMAAHGPDVDYWIRSGRE